MRLRVGLMVNSAARAEKSLVFSAVCSLQPSFEARNTKPRKKFPRRRGVGRAVCRIDDAALI